MKALVVAAKKKNGVWEGALITNGDLTQVEKPMNVAEFVGVALTASLENEDQVIVEIKLGKIQGQ